MNSRFVIPVIWTLTGALLVKLLAAWNRLPERVAVHFGADMRPNGWGSKTVLAAVVLIAVPSQAALATFLLLHVGSASAPMALIHLVVSAVVVSAFWQTINYNAKGTPFRPMWLFVPMIALFGSITVFLVKLMFDYYRR